MHHSAGRDERGHKQGRRAEEDQSSPSK
jgi:hypothetical protein